MSESQQRIKKFEKEPQPARALDKRGLLACLMISMCLTVWITLASGRLNLRSVLFLLVLPWVLLRAGGIITGALRLPSFFALDFVLGVAVVSVGVLAWKILVPFSLWLLFGIVVLAVAGVPKLLPPHRRDPLSALGLLSVIASLAAATGWSRDFILPTSPVQDGIVFKPWTDFFTHAAFVVRSVGIQTLSQVGNYEWKGFPAIAYHYASYSLVSCLAKAGRLHAYDAVVGFWVPFGSFLTGLASYALGRAIWSQAAGLAALIAVLLLPDAALLNVAHPFYGYFWLQHIAPGGLYGVAIAGAALVLVSKGTREGRRAWIVSGVVVGSLVAFFKVQVFIAAFPLLFSFAVLAWPKRTPMRWLVLGGCITAGVILLPLANRSYIAPNVHFGFSGSASYWKLLAGLASDTRLASCYRVFDTDNPFPLHLARAIGLLLLSAFGIFAVAAPLVWLLAIHRKEWQASDGISATAVAILLLMTFGLSGDRATSGTIEQLAHRPFVWAYWLVGSLTAGHLLSIVVKRRPERPTWLALVSILVLMPVPIWFGSGLERGRWRGADRFCDLRVDQGLVDCAYYIRSQPPVDAVVQDSQLDEFLILGGLSERPSFAARLEVWKAASRAFRESPYQEQLRKLQDLQRATNVWDLQRGVLETGIRWYVVHPGDHIVWPAEFRDRPAFESNGYQVYDMRRCFDLRQ